jgi:hypothetical protein
MNPSNSNEEGPEMNTDLYKIFENRGKEKFA